MLFHQGNLLVILATITTASARGLRQDKTLNKRQGFIPNCTYSTEALDGDTCRTLADFGNITLEQFKSYNPQITNCNALTVGASYCLEKNFGQPDPVSTASPFSSSQVVSTSTQVGAKTSSISVSPTSAKASSTSIPPTSTKSANSAPAPTQDGVATNCNRWDVIQDNDSCAVYTTKYPGLTIPDLFKFNPAIGSECRNLWVGYALCTSVEGWKPTPISSTILSAKPTASAIPGAVPAPGDTQPGAAANCNRWDIVKSDTDCGSFTKKYPGLTLANLVAWNPAIGSECRNLWLGYYVCTSVVGFVAPTKITTSAASNPTSNAPGPVQSGINTKCKKYHKVVKDDGCFDLAKKYGIKLEDFYKWNPSVKTDCSVLWPDYYVCVGI